MIEPAGILRALDIHDPRATRRNDHRYSHHEYVSTIPLARFIDQHTHGQDVDQCLSLWADLGWEHDPSGVISRRLRRLHSDPWIKLHNVEDWLTAGPWLLSDIYPTAAAELEETTL